ncbi:MAG: VWA domain-containing protein [Verrucomicrobiales bacterium]|jgi:Ca-activated chloride channel family protein|nr:VWA domain-containing protein [Verrucomicrobiales bacterium]
MKTLLSLITLLAFAVSGRAETETLTIKAVPERDYVLRADGREIVVSVDLDGAALKNRKSGAPLNIAVVLDKSGSMEGAKLEQAKQAACVLLDRLTSQDYFSLVIFDSSVSVLVPAQRVENKELIRDKIMSIRAGSSTALYAGVKEGAKQIREYVSSNRINRVILLSDGMANVGPDSPQALAKLGRQLAKEKIRVTTIGLGDDYNEDLMMALAEAGEANYYYVRDTEKLPGIFAKELGYLQNVIARDIRIIIQLPANVEAVEIIGRPEVRFEKNCATLSLGEFYAEQRKNFLVRCKIVKASKNDQMDVANVQVNYRDEQSASEKQSSSLASVKFTKDQAKADGSLNTEVSKQVAWFNNVQARQQAFDLAEQGKAKEAAQVLRQQAVANAALPAAVQSEKLMKDNASLNATANTLEEKQSLDSSSRKAFQFDNYNLKEQKQ